MIKKIKILNFNSINSGRYESFKTHYPDVNDENRIESWSKLELNYPKIIFWYV